MQGLPDGREGAHRRSHRGLRWPVAAAAALAVGIGASGGAHALGKVKLELLVTNATGSNQSFFYNPPPTFRSLAPGKTVHQTVELEGPGFDRRTGTLLGGAHGGVHVPLGKCYFTLDWETDQSSRTEYRYKSCSVKRFQGGDNCIGKATVVSPTLCRVELKVK